MRTLIVVGLTIFGLAVGGCGAGTTGTAAAPSSPATPSSPAASSPADSPSASPADSGPRPCATADLTMSIPHSNSAKFEEASVLDLTNKGTATCTLTGYPELQFVGDSGDLPTTETHRAGTVATITLPPGATANAFLLWNKYEGQGTTCPPFPTAVRVTLPGQAPKQVPWITEDLARSVCGGKIAVGPIVAGS